jgi:thioredoxin 1
MVRTRAEWFPVIEQLAKELQEKVVFGKVNVDENPLIASAFGIRVYQL